MKKVYLFLCLLLAGMLAQAATNNWIGAATGGVWDNASNWSDGIPTADDDVVITTTGATAYSISLDFATSTTVNSIAISGTVNVTFATTGSIRTINLGGGGNTTTALTIASGRALTLNSPTASMGIVINIPAGSSTTINGTLNFATFGTGGTVGTGQVNQLIGLDVNSIQFSSTGSATANARQAANIFGSTGAVDEIVLFKTGSRFTSYSNSSPFGTSTAPAAISKFEQGTTYAIFGGSGYPNLGGRTLGTLQIASGATASISNATALTTTILDSFIVTSATVTLLRGSGGTSNPNFNLNNVRVSAAGGTNVGVVLSNNGFDNSSFVINGGVIVNTASAAAGNATLTFGAGAENTTNTSTSITFTGSGKSIATEDQGAGAGVPSIIYNSPSAVNTGVKTTNINIDSTASITLNANLNLTTANSGISNLTVRTKGVLSIGTGFTLTTNDKLTLQSTVTGTGSIGNGSGTISGNTIVQRYIPANAAWRTIGLPFNGATNTYVGGTAGTNEVSLSYFAAKSPTWAYYYNDAADNGNYGTGASVNAGWTAISGSTTGLSTKNGLLVYGSRISAAQTLSGTGSLNYGTQSILLSKASTNGWNLIANPYASNISWTSVVDNSENASGVLASTTVYRVNPLGGGAYSFSSYASGSGTGVNGGSNVIENGAAFFVKAAAAVNLTIKEANKTTNAVGSTSGGVTLMGANDNYNSIRVSLKGANTFSDEVVFVWGRFSKATEAFDNDLDAYDLGASGTHDLSIVDKEGTRYAIFNGADLPRDAETRTYKLATKNLRLGTYDFEVSMPKALDRNNEAYLVDNYLGTAVLVKEGLSHSFQVTADAASKAEGRFQLEVRKKLTSVIDEVATSKTYLLSNPTRNNQFAIHFGSDAQVANWQVVDLSGRVISTGMFKNVYQGDTRVGELKALQSGTYLVRLFSDNEPTVVMKLVKL
jgi:hypothetical protein